MLKIKKEDLTFEEEPDDFIGEFYMIASQHKELIPILKALTAQRKDLQKVKARSIKIDMELEKIKKKQEERREKEMKKSMKK